MTRDELMSALEACSSRRGSETCNKCVIGGMSNVTLTCYKLLDEAAEQLAKSYHVFESKVTFAKGEDVLFHIPEAHIDQLHEMYSSSEKEKKTIEECAELIQAITKYSCLINSINPYASFTFCDKCNLEHARDHIIEEMAHVGIMLALLKREFNITQKEIDLEVLKKAKEARFDLSNYPERFQPHNEET